MQLVNTLCAAAEATHPFINSIIMWFALTPLLLGCIVSILAIKAIKNLAYKIVVIAIGVLPTLIVSFVLSIILVVVMDHKLNPTPQASYYFPLNAAIKNTCYLDPKMVHCPRTVEDLIAIQPQDFTSYLDKAHLTYSYYPATNEYTLIARYSKRRAVIFDSRLKDERLGKPDFIEVKVSSCGQDHIINPPSFPGPWNNL